MTASSIRRHIPGPGGLLATRDGASGGWTIGFGDPNGDRFFTDLGGVIQDVDYRAFGQVTSTGSPQDPTYSGRLWNGGDRLEAEIKWRDRVLFDRLAAKTRVEVGGGRELTLGQAVTAVVLDHVDQGKIAPAGMLELPHADVGRIAVAADPDAQQPAVGERCAGGY